MDPFTAYLADLERRRPAAAGQGPESLVVLRRVASTNRLAREIVAEYEREAQHLHSVLLLAFEQSEGRGRQGRSWTSPAGQGIYATRIQRVEDIADLQTLPLLVGVALCRALAPHLPVPCRLKWPNDLIVETAAGRRKIGGILIEALVHPNEETAAILGFGINYGYAGGYEGGHGAGELPETGTSLRRLGAGASLGQVTWDVLVALERELAHLGDADYAVAAYREHTLHQPGDPITARVGDGVTEGRFRGFDEHGRLLLDRDGEEVRLTAGEVIE